MSLDWGVQLARLTLFSSEQLTVSDKDWQAITGQGSLRRAKQSLEEGALAAKC